MSKIYELDIKAALNGEELIDGEDNTVVLIHRIYGRNGCKFPLVGLTTLENEKQEIRFYTLEGYCLGHPKGCLRRKELKDRKQSKQGFLYNQIINNNIPEPIQILTILNTEYYPVVGIETLGKNSQPRLHYFSLNGDSISGEVRYNLSLEPPKKVKKPFLSNLIDKLLSPCF